MVINTNSIIVYIKQVIDNLTQLNIDTKTRQEDYIRARCLFYYACHRYTNASLSQIGGLLGKQHATVIHGLKTHKSFLKDFHYLKVKVEVDRIVSMLVDKNYSEIYDIEVLKMQYINDLNKINYEAQEKIDKLKRKLTLEHPVLENLSKLSDDILNELEETRIKPFLKMKNIKTASI